MTESVRDYHVFGLRLRSALDLPELFPADGAAEPDVLIDMGPIDAPPSNPGLEPAGGGLLLTVPEVARFLVREGRSIQVEPHAGIDPRNVRLFLLGSAFGVLLHQRGLLPLHANAVEINGQAVIFMGASGAGKSTLAAWFHDQGYRVLADDVCVVRFDEQGRAVACRGLPRLRLWAEALELMGRDAAEYSRSYVGEREQMDKFDVPINRAEGARSDVRMRALYLLDRGEVFSVTQLQGTEAAEAIFANTYRGAYLSAVNGQQEHWRSAIRLVQSVPVYRAVREWDLSLFDAQCRHLIEHVASALRS